MLSGCETAVRAQPGSPESMAPAASISAIAFPGTILPTRATKPIQISGKSVREPAEPLGGSFLEGVRFHDSQALHPRLLRHRRHLAFLQPIAFAGAGQERRPE